MINENNITTKQEKFRVEIRKRKNQTYFNIKRQKVFEN